MTDKTNNILVTGASGYIGPYVLNEIIKSKKNGFEGNIYAAFNSHAVEIPGVSAFKLDLRKRGNLSKIFSEIDPAVVIHLASGTPTRISGQNNEFVKEINVNATEQIAKLCASNNSLMIYTSSDLVYESGIDLDEDNPRLNPITAYAQTKLEGEEAVKRNASKYIIFRTALVYGFTRSAYESFFDTAYSKLAAGEHQRAFTDQYRNAIYIEDAAKILSEIPYIYSKNDTINLCGDEYLSRFDMCMLMSEVFGFKRDLVIPASADEFILYPMIKQLGLKKDKLKKLGFKTFSFRQNLLRAMNFRPAK